MGKYKSKLEENVAQILTDKGMDFTYETVSVEYMKTYKPDFVLDNGIILECKGYHYNFKGKMYDTVKAILQNPQLDIRMVIDKPNRNWSKTMEFKDFLDKYGIKWCTPDNIPPSWLEPKRGKD